MSTATVERPPTRPHADVRTLAKGGALGLVGTIGRGVLGFAMVLVLTRGLGAAGAGFFFSIVAVFTMLSGIQMGASTALVRFISRDLATGHRERIRPTLRVATVPILVAGSVVGVATWFLAPALSRALFDPAYVDEGITSLRLLAPLVPLGAFSDALASGTRGFGTLAPYVLIDSLAKPTARPLAVLIVLALGLGTVATIVAWAIPLVVALPFLVAWTLILQRRAEREGPSVEDARVDLPAAGRRSLAREFWAFSIPQGFTTLFQVGLRWIDVVMVGALRSAREAGIYAAVSRTIMFGTFAIDALRLAIAPQISSLFASDHRERAQDVYRFATWWLILASWPFYIAIAVFAPVILQAFGHGFGAGQHALMIISIGMLVSTGTGNVGVVLAMGGRSLSVMVTTGIALATNAGLNLVLIPHIGMVGAAIAWVAGIMVSNTIALWLVSRHLRVDPFGRGFAVAALAPIACFGGLGLLARLVFGADLTAVAVGGLAATICYVAVIAAFRRTLHLTDLWAVIQGRRRRRSAPDLEVMTDA